MSVAAPAPERDAAMLDRYARTRDPAIRDQLVRRYLPLARYAANQYANSHEPFDDLLQIASLGLLKAIDRFDPRRRNAFSSYALPTMSGELRRHLRDRGWAVRPPRDLLERALIVERSATELQRALSRSPKVAEIGRATGLDRGAVLDAREALSARRFMSLSTTARPNEEDDETILDRCFGATDDGYDTAEQRATLAPLLARLPARDRRILRLRFEQDLTQAEIGRIVGLSQMHVSRVLRTSLEHLRSLAAVTA
ncbi:MAG TPA: sigma-70 family RNA polymerase sigma factor [Baekduia sp.]|uniref:sigma-70 family RNA polymerase sigma factor n=1 Tax=Baekduia sp. TaxID=2600305 RepID=UPI002C5CB77E|nr:sigma-70 family RNA polymerase sigma factor [Baekduia sp.]HMJ35056.1 sigma-70 family RNA polymerase sigma factor [Baekduia sp.]